MIEEVDEQQYQEILSKLEDAHLAEKVGQSEEWKVVQKAAKLMRDSVQEQYNRIDFSKPEANLQAIQCQVAIQFYDDWFKSVLERYKAIGEEAYSYASNMGWIENMALWIKSNF